MTHPKPDDLPQTLPLSSGQPAAPPSEATLAVPGSMDREGAADSSVTLPLGARPVELEAARERSAPALRAAVHIPGYEILGELGRGGMGVVYKAMHLALKRTVALKMILAGDYADEAELGRFRTEGKAVARLQHPNIVQIHEVGEYGGLPYFALEFVDGGSLAQKLAGGPLAPREAARLVETLAGAVQLAHSRNIVHRDLKPANILLTADGAPKITDFGLAKQLDADSGQTRTGAVMGTPGYMAPEQASGRAHDAGPAADVYALGAILYECLTGRPPFKGDSVLETLERVRTQEPASPSQLQRSTPRDLETICLKCLRKEPERRYASAEALAEDLRHWRQGEPIAARAVGSVERAVKWVRRHAAASALAAAALLATLLGVAGVVWKYLDAEQQKGIAEQQKGIAVAQEKEALHEADKAKKARDFLVSIFRISETGSRGGNVTAREILAGAEGRIPVEFADQPELRADLEAAVAEVKHSIDLTIPAALILEASGSIQIQSARGVIRPAVPQALLYPEDRLALGRDAHLRLYFLTDLHQEQLKPGREATLGRQGCEPADAIAERNTQDALMRFVRLPKGTFYMGWGADEKGRPVNKVVKTEIKEDFEIAVFDVTQGQWQAVMGDNPSWFSRTGLGKDAVRDVSDEELKLFPVESVSWNDVHVFIQKLNEKERDRGYLHRLPTQAEWEYACRNGAASEEECSHPFYIDKPTDVLSSDQANFDGTAPFPPGKLPKGKFLQHTTRVGAYPPNKLGLCDMHGNVCQWCEDLFHPNDPGDLERVFRGGSWVYQGFGCQAGALSKDRPDDPSSDVGFRLARVPSGGK